LVDSEIIIQRGGAAVDGDTWLDRDADWRSGSSGILGAEVQPIWFFWDDVSCRGWGGGG
jgi:hypothetical protein